MKKSIKQKKVILLILIIIGAVGYGVYRIAPTRNVESLNYEQIATGFIFENDPAFVEDGYNLELISQENLVDGSVKLIFNYDLYSYPEGDKFMVEIIVNSKGEAYMIEAER